MNDTHPEAERVQIELIRKMPHAKRAALAARLRNRTYWMARRAIDAAHPELSEADRKLLFIEVHYGAELAQRVREHWSKRIISNA
jgi:hypothetical protein